MVHRRFVHVAEGDRSFDEEVIHDRGNSVLLACSPHGGMIEQHTGKQAVLLESLLPDCSAWYCRGFKEGGGAYDEFHVTSTAIDADSFRFLPALYDERFTYAVSFHGYGGDGILVGGGASRTLKRGLRDCLTDLVRCPVELVSDGEYAGTDDENVVNEVARHGLQIEQGIDVRERSWRNVVRAVQLFFEGLS